MLRIAALLILLPCVAFAQVGQLPPGADTRPRNELPTGKQYLTGQLAAAEAKVSDMLDEIARLTKERDMLREMLSKREKPKE